MNRYGLDDLLARLIGAKFQFVVVGGFAAVAHGVSLLTQDLDVCCAFSAANLLRLQKALADLHPVHRMTPQRVPLALTATRCRGLRNLYLSTDWGMLDCLGAVTGVGAYATVSKASVALGMDFGTCRFLDLDALIASKDAMNRPKDREAAAQLRAIRRRQQGRGPKESTGEDTR